MLHLLKSKQVRTSTTPENISTHHSIINTHFSTNKAALDLVVPATDIILNSRSIPSAAAVVLAFGIRCTAVARQGKHPINDD